MFHAEKCQGMGTRTQKMAMDAMDTYALSVIVNARVVVS